MPFLHHIHLIKEHLKVHVNTMHANLEIIFATSLVVRSARYVVKYAAIPGVVHGHGSHPHYVVNLHVTPSLER